jgi:hypothetical protein
MKRREALTALAAVPLAALASSAASQETKKAGTEAKSAGGAKVAETGVLETEVCIARSVDLVALAVQKQTMPMGPAIYTGTITATVSVPSADWRILAVQAIVVRGTQQHGPVALVKDEFSGKYVGSVSFPGAAAGESVVAKVLAVYEYKMRGESDPVTLP